DDRRRTHDMNTANWIPDLFIKRVLADADWTLFSPADTPDLHDLYGLAFEKAYEGYEQLAEAGEIPHKKIRATELWMKMIKMIYETGHPWFTFKDACNIRSPQQHTGVVHSSNLCTEITLNTSREEIAVCNLGSINLVAHMRGSQLDEEMIAATVKTAIRMLDNVIDLNYYSVDKARNSNMRHRPIGLGMMGFQDCLYEAGITYDSQEAVEFADRSAELIAYHAYWASSDLAVERGRYESYDGSLWSRGILPPDTLAMLAAERNNGEKPKVNGAIDSPYLQIDMSAQLDWNKLRAKISKDGIRNSNCLAIAPTATIANIVGVTASIEPTYQNLFTKSNLSGEFKTINGRLVRDLQKLGLWDALMISEIKQHDGEIGAIERIPENIRRRYVTAFNIDQKWLIEAAGRRQKWLDQAQSLNLYVANPRGRDLAALYTLAWQRGLKTTYYLRSIQASSTEKYSTHATGNMNSVKIPEATACSINDPECESCAG
ncbi:MAG: ribonucleoside-diphosphate reductase subunit alpha, partial [Betaproteobacteria bacterium]|nr:ribonucleoside-diphosphate reductase subunit alpha [Betaproteobacteria bacterium]